MSGPDRVAPLLETVIRSIVGGPDEERDERASTFARGLALGALVGAAIAGSTIWQRRQAQRKRVEGETAARGATTTPSD